MVPSADTYCDTSYVPPYVRSVNPYRALSEQYIEALQEERRITIEQVKYLGIIIASGEITVYEAA